jgi:hypothetical protein
MQLGSQKIRGNRSKEFHRVFERLSGFGVHNAFEFHEVTLAHAGLEAFWAEDDMPLGALSLFKVSIISIPILELRAYNAMITIR